MINEQQLLSNYRQLPTKMQEQVWDFIRFLWFSFKEKQDASENLLNAVRPIRQTLSIEDIKKEQAHKITSRLAVKKIAQEMDIQEPISDLLNDLTA